MDSARDSARDSEPVMKYKKSKAHILLTAYILWTACLNGCTFGQSIIQGPENTAATISESSLINCTVDRGTDSIYWTFYANGTGTGDRIYTYNGVDVIIPDPNYDVDPSGIDQGIFNLIIHETAMATAGIYRCSLFMADLHAEARFVSVAPVTCDPPPGDKEIIEGATVILTCDVAYTGYKPPSLTWTLAEGSAPLQGEWVWNYERSTYYANVTAEPDLDMVEFTCHLEFVNDVGESGEPPNYNDNCSTHFMVLHGATRMAIVPDPNGVVNVQVGDTVNCSASGRPPPSFSWEGADGEIFLGSVLHVLAEWTDQQKVFTCYARNEVLGQPHEASLPIEIFVTNPEPLPQEPSEAAIEPWVIAVAVTVPVVVLAAAGGGAYAYVKHQKKKNKENGGLPSNRTMASGPVMQPPPGARPPPGRGPPNGFRPPGPQPYQNKAVISGIPVAGLSGTSTTQNRYPGGDSPGYGDLGIRHFSSTNSGLNASSVELDPGKRRVSGGATNLAVSRSSLGPAAPDGGPYPVGKRPSDVTPDHSVASGQRPSYPSNQNVYQGPLELGGQTRALSASRTSLQSPASRQLDNSVYSSQSHIPDTSV